MPTNSELIEKAQALKTLYTGVTKVATLEIEPNLENIQKHRTGEDLTALSPSDPANVAHTKYYDKLNSAYGRILVAFDAAVGIQSGTPGSASADPKYQLDPPKPNSEIIGTIDPGHQAGEFLESDDPHTAVTSGGIFGLNEPRPQGYSSWAQPDPNARGYTAKIADRLDAVTQQLIKDLQAALEAEADANKIKQLQQEITDLKALAFRKQINDLEFKVENVDPHYLERMQRGAVKTMVDMGRHAEKNPNMAERMIFGHPNFTANATVKYDEDGEAQFSVNVVRIPLFSETGRLHAVGHMVGAYFEAKLEVGKTVLEQKIDPKTGNTIMTPKRDPEPDGPLVRVPYTTNERAELTKNNPFNLTRLPADPSAAVAVLMNTAAHLEAMGSSLQGFNPGPPVTIDPTALERWMDRMSDQAQYQFKALMRTPQAAYDHAKNLHFKEVICKQIEDAVRGELDPNYIKRNERGILKKIGMGIVTAFIPNSMIKRTTAKGNATNEQKIQIEIAEKQKEYQVRNIEYQQLMAKKGVPPAADARTPAEITKCNAFENWKTLLAQGRYFDINTNSAEPAPAMAAVNNSSTPAAGMTAMNTTSTNSSALTSQTPQAKMAANAAVLAAKALVERLNKTTAPTQTSSSTISLAASSGAAGAPPPAPNATSQQSTITLGAASTSPPASAALNTDEADLKKLAEDLVSTSIPTETKAAYKEALKENPVALQKYETHVSGQGTANTKENEIVEEIKAEISKAQTKPTQT